MVRSRYSLSGVMKLVGLVAVDLALLPLPGVLGVPFLAFLGVAVNVVLVQAFVRWRPLRVRDYTFLVAGTAYFVLLSLIPPVAQIPGLRPVLQRFFAGLDAFLEWWSVVTDSSGLWRLFHSPLMGGVVRWSVTLFGLLVAWQAGRLVERRLERRDQHGEPHARPVLVALCQGAIIGLGLAALGVMPFAFFPGVHPEFRLAVRLLPAAPVLGGLVGWWVATARLRRPKRA